MSMMVFEFIEEQQVRHSAPPGQREQQLDQPALFEVYEDIGVTNQQPHESNPTSAAGETPGAALSAAPPPSTRRCNPRPTRGRRAARIKWSARADTAHQAPVSASQSG